MTITESHNHSTYLQIIDELLSPESSRTNK
jgi:hypothetical protein